MSSLSLQVLALCGSTRATSVNLQLIRAIGALLRPGIALSVYDGLASLPQFNPDMDTPDAVPATVTSFRQQVRAADGILICTPEYAHGIPGSLKNAIDWTVSQASFSGKPVALITAATDGRAAHTSLLEVLHVLEARKADELQLLISFVKTRVDENGITDAHLKEQVIQLMDAFIKELSAADYREFH